jgi:hypothetical protein
MDPNTGIAQTIGIFDNCSYGLTYTVQPAFILGRFSAAELGYTSQEPVHITCSGWRVIGHGPFADGHLPQLQDLLTADYISMQVVDRQTGNPVATFESVRPTGFSTSIQARQLESMTLNFMGITIDDETADNSEAVTAAGPAADLP